MKAHLDTGCNSCSSVLNLWQRVQGIAHRESAFEPPAGPVRVAKEMFVLHLPTKTRSNRVVSATLLFDSFVQPQMAGVRSAESAVRQLLYASGEFHIDIRIEPQEDSDKVAVVGQVLDANDPGQSFEQVPIILFRSGKPRAEAITNRFGEFRLECVLESGLYLRVSVPGGPELRVPVLEPTLIDEDMEPETTDSATVKRLLPGRKTYRKKD